VQGQGRTGFLTSLKECTYTQKVDNHWCRRNATTLFF